MTAFWIIAAFIVITSFWLAADSHTLKIPADQRPYAFNNGAMAWFLSAVLLWPVTVPLYFSVRSNILRRRERARQYDLNVLADDIIKYKKLYDDGIISKSQYSRTIRKLLDIE